MKRFVARSVVFGGRIVAKDKTKGKKSKKADSRMAQGMAEADGAVDKIKKRDYEAELERLQLELVYRSGLLMSQRPNGLNPPGVTGEPFEKGWLFPVGPKRLGERILQQGDRLECPV